MSNFMRNQEQTVTVSSVTDLDGWETTVGNSQSFTGIVSVKLVKIDSPDSSTKVGAAQLTVHLKSNDGLDSVTVGSIVTFNDVDYTVLMVDKRNKLPTKYKNKIVAVNK